MRKAPTICILATVLAAGSAGAFGQSLEDLAELQRKAAAAKSCEEILKAGGSDERCSGFHRPAPAAVATPAPGMPGTPAMPGMQPVPPLMPMAAGAPGASGPAGASSAVQKPAEEPVQVVSYRALEVDGAMDEQIEVLVDGQQFRMKVGDTVKGWKLTALNEFEAVFVGQRHERRSVGFRAPAVPRSATQPATAGMPGSLLSGGLGVPPLMPLSR